MCGTQAAAKQRPSVRRGRRQYHVDVNTVFEQPAPYVEGLFRAVVVDGDDRTCFGADAKPQFLEPSIQKVGIDIGGTFTDVCLWDGRSIRTGKAPTTPQGPVEGVLTALGQLGLDNIRFDAVQGSTVATNALLEKMMI